MCMPCESGNHQLITASGVRRRSAERSRDPRFFFFAVQRLSRASTAKQQKQKPPVEAGLSPLYRLRLTRVDGCRLSRSALHGG
eukprot:7362006-Prymnesium_polylepis.1